jgi:hypothetical protein
MNEESSAPPALRAGQWEKERIIVPEEEGRKGKEEASLAVIPAFSCLHPHLSVLLNPDCLLSYPQSSFITRL